MSFASHRRMSSYWREFLTLAVAHGLAVASPGPDFAIVLRQSLRHGRRTALWTSVGIGSGLGVHVTYCLFGLGYLLQRSPVALTTVKYLGAAYLAWVGIQALRSRARTDDVDLASGATAPSTGAAWSAGFLVNVLNPKVALFFISFFSLAISPATPRWIQAGYGLWMVGTTIVWFSFVSIVFARDAVRRAFLRHRHWIDRALGVVFLGFAAMLAVATLR